MATLARQINSCKWLFLAGICEPVANALRLEIHEAKVRSQPEPDACMPGETDDQGIRWGNPIEHAAGCRIFVLDWPDYVAYSVRDENYVIKDDYEIFEGRKFVRFTRSRYMDFVAHASIADESYPGPMTHWGVFCLDHVIDVISCSDPTWRVSVAE